MKRNFRTDTGSPLALVALFLAWPLAFHLGMRWQRPTELLLGVALFFSVWVFVPARSAARVNRSPVGRDLVLGGAVGVATVLVSRWAWPLVASIWPGAGDEMARLTGAITTGGYPGGWLPVALVVGLEEWLFRGAWLSRCLARWPVTPAAGLAAAGYACAQIGAGSGLLVVAALGLGLIWTGLRLYTQALLAPLVAHEVWTLCVLFFWPLPSA